MSGIDNSNNSPLAYSLIAAIMFAMVLSINLSATAKNEPAKRASQAAFTAKNKDTRKLTLEQRRELVFKKVDELKTLHNPSPEQAEDYVGRPLIFYVFGIYKTPAIDTCDIIEYEMPYDSDEKVLYFFIKVNEKLQIRISDVQKHFGKYTKSKKVRIRGAFNDYSELVYYFDQGKLTFHFRSKNYEYLSSIHVRVCDLN